MGSAEGVIYAEILTRGDRKIMSGGFSDESENVINTYGYPLSDGIANSRLC
jgi:hypothetical protein